EIGKLVTANRAAGGGEHHVEVRPGRLVLRQRHDGGDGLALLQRQNIDQRLATRLWRGNGQPPDLLFVDLAARREIQNRRVRRGDEQARNEIFLTHLHPAATFATAPLRAIGRERYALDVALVRDSDDHLLARNQVFFFHVTGRFRDHRAAGRRELILYVRELFLDDRLDARTRTQDIEIVGDFSRELVELCLDLIAAERGQTLQAQVEYGFCLLGGKLRRAFRRNFVARIVDQRHHRRDVLGRPVALHQGFARLLRILGGTNESDHFVDIGDSDGKPDQDMGAVARLGEQVLGTSRYDLFAKDDEGIEHILQRHHQRAPAIERHHVAAE